MNIHEYQAKELFRQYGVPTPIGYPAFTVEEAVAAAQKLPGPVWVVKAQIHAGGRGKGKFKEPAAGEKGGVRLAKSIDEVRTYAEQMLGNTLVTVQTGPAGRVVKRLYIENGSEIDRELYLSALVDRGTSRIAFIASQAGGMDIEQVAHETPEKIFTLSIDPATGYSPFHGRKIAFALGLTGDQVNQCVKMVGDLYRLFVEKDMSLLEVNPLILTKDGKLLCLDAKFNFDDNALFRHKDLVEMADPTEENPAELRAHRFGLSYIALDGNIGCLVNGAGLAMATMDIIKLHGGEPANFLDVGGGASEEAVTEAFSIILSDPNVKGVLVNIFGGIMRCDVIAQGIINAARNFKNADGSVGFKVPLVVRLEGTNVEAGRQLLNDARKDIPTMQAATDLTDAAKKVCAAVA